MKYLFTMLLLFTLSGITSGKNTYDNLFTLNRYWQQHPEMAPEKSILPASDRDWIRLHLTMVEQTLRHADVRHLSASQISNRILALDHLKEYLAAGNFPINEDYSYRTPIFIDKYDNFCAVGYLVKATGHEGISRMIAANTNLAYVADMKYPELAAWAQDYGFAVDELAWIQPTYGPLPSRHGKGLGKGTNGEIYELFVTSNNPRLFVGGDFTMADSTVSANHIAYVLESNGNYSWHSMGTGVNGPVNAIAEFNNKIFVAGEFTEAGGSPASNIAYWDGANWFDAGCISGVVNDLVVFSGELYAAGDFDVCTGMAEVNFAKWNGGVWQPIPGISGFVNTMEVVDTFIYLGGSFGLGLNPENVARWSSNSGFEIFPNMIENEVRDFEIFKDTVFASCRRTSAMDSNLVVKLVGGSWQPYNAMAPYVYSSLVHIQFQPSFNTLLTQADTLILGGSFINSAMMSGPDIQNNVNLYSPGGVVNWFVVDDAINKMVIFKNELIFAGKFKTAFNYLSGQDTLNHIGRKTYPFLNSIPQLPGNDAVARIYPNPVSGNDITVENNFGATSYIVTDMSGRLLASGDMQEEKENIKLPALSAGNYMVTLTNGEVKKTERLVIR